MIDEALSERLRLRRWTSELVDPFAAMNSDAEIMRFVGNGAPPSAAESRALSERFEAQWADYGFGLWAAESRSSGEFLGFVASRTRGGSPRWPSRSAGASRA